MTNKKEVMVRVNSRIRKDQHKFIKDYAKKNEIFEGEVHRNIIDYFIKKHATK